MEETLASHKSGFVAFRPHARLIRLLGDELISDEIMAATELVKNAYDADASHISIHLEQVTDPAAGSISIRDDGDGMDLFTLLHIWMEPATTHKRKRHRQRERTHQGRILLGEKGVGRFAADKLGAELELVTRSRSLDREIVLQVSWQQFDAEDTYLEDVQSGWHEREPVTFPGEQHGTLLTIRLPRVTWSEDMVSRLYNGLSRLVSPFVPVADFVIDIRCPEFPLLQGKVVNRLLETAPYRLSGVIDGNGQLTMTGSQAHTIDLCQYCGGQFLLPSGERRAPLCGPFKLALHIWDLDIQAGKSSGIDRARRDAIKSFSGVSIYRDGFRVWPYGERDDDWLELNQRRVNNPTQRVSNNQIIGFIEITHDDNPELKDRTSREGLIDTLAFFDLKALALAALSLVEAERFTQRHQFTLSRTQVETQQDRLLSYFSHVESIKTAQGQPAPDTEVSREIERLYRQKLVQERERYDRLSVLAGVGMAAELLNSALAQEINDTVLLLQTLEGEVRVDANVRVQALIGSLTEKMQTIHEQLNLTEPLYHPRSQLNEPVYLKRAIYDVLVAMRSSLMSAGVRIQLNCEADLTVRISRGYLMQALMIILVNALEVMAEGKVAGPSIVIQVAGEHNTHGILIANNGPLVPEQYRRLIFEPAFSMHQAGRGLGLHVARDLLAICHCSLELAEDISLLSGSCFRIRFDGRRVVN